MARPRRNASPATELSPGQAAYVLDRMLRERRISQGEVNGFVAEMGREINELEQRLERLRAAHGGASSSAASTPSAPVRRRPGRPVGSGTGRKRGRPAAAAAAQSTAAPAAAAAPAAKGRRRSKQITAEQLASRQLQGRYLALVRQFPERKRLEFAKIAKERGREAAIKEMQAAKK
jgi:hypothetical protein